MANRLLRSLLIAISENDPAWYVLIATDIGRREKLNISIRWINSNYEISEDPIGLYCLPNTAAETVYEVLSDVVFLFHCAEDKHMMGHLICKEYELVLSPQSKQKPQLHCLSIAWPIR